MAAFLAAYKQIKINEILQDQLVPSYQNESSLGQRCLLPDIALPLHLSVPSSGPERNTYSAFGVSQPRAELLVLLELLLLTSFFVLRPKVCELFGELNSFLGFVGYPEADTIFMLSHVPAR